MAKDKQKPFSKFLNYRDAAPFPLAPTRSRRRNLVEAEWVDGGLFGD